MIKVKKFKIKDLYRNGLSNRGWSFFLTSFVEFYEEEDKFIMYYHPKLFAKVLVTVILPIILVLQGVLSYKEVLSDYSKFVCANRKNKRLCSKDEVRNKDSNLFKFLKTKFAE